MFSEICSYSTFIFDYDNTIARIPVNWFNARLSFRTFLKKNFPKLEIKANMRVDQMEGVALLAYPDQIDLILSYRRDLEFSLTGMHEVIPSTVELIKFLDSSDLFIISNNLRHTIISGLNQLGLSKHFKMVIGIDDAKMPKPSLNSWEILKNHYPGMNNPVFIGDNDQTDGNFCRKICIPFINVVNLQV